MNSNTRIPQTLEKFQVVYLSVTADVNTIRFVNVEKGTQIYGAVTFGSFIRTERDMALLSN